jgi:hypothetical protein
MSRLNVTAISLALILWALIFMGISKSDFSSRADLRIDNYDATLVAKIAIRLNNQVSASLSLRIRSNLSRYQYTRYGRYFIDYPVLMTLPKWISSDYVNVPVALTLASTAVSKETT